MSVKVRTKKGKTYVLNREEFQRFMRTLWERSQAHKAHKAYKADKEKEKDGE